MAAPALTSLEAFIIASQSYRRVKYTQQQIAFLESEYSHDKFAKKKRRTFIASYIGMTENQVKNWFQNKRTKGKENKGNKNNIETMKVTQNVKNIEHTPTNPKCHNENNTAKLELMNQHKRDAIWMIIRYLEDPRLFYAPNTYDVSADLDDLMTIIHNDLIEDALLQFDNMEKGADTTIYADNTLQEKLNDFISEENIENKTENIPKTYNTDNLYQTQKLADGIREEIETVEDMHKLLCYF
uniref:Homeobox protein Ht-En n=1 Tax=Zeugodacus cucurbitae TaxID=28588 RepID=A0A0A1XQI8_ZEUCU